GDNNIQRYESYGGLLRLENTFANDITLTAIGSWETTEGFSIGDIDGGNLGGPGFIPFPSVTQDGIDTLDQYTAEVRLASGDGPFTWQFGALYFSQQFEITTSPFFVGSTSVGHDNDSWAVFGQTSFDLTDNLTATAGLRYTDDTRDFEVIQLFGAPATGLGPEFSPSTDEGELTWDLALNLAVNDETTLFTRYARGFRAPTIQGRDVAFFGVPSVADSETVDSFEVGMKNDFGVFRSNIAVFYYTVQDQQLTAIGGDGNLVQLVNADEATGFGIEGDLEAIFNMSEKTSLLTRIGGSYVDTEINDDDLLVAPCGSGACTPLDPLVDGNALVDGNPLPQAPGFTLSLLARYTVDLGEAQFFLQTDWWFQGETNFFLYESEESFTDDAYEGALRAGFSWNDGRYEIAGFGRNITDNEFARGGIDFNNLTGFVNAPRIWGVTFTGRY
ncbi:MAG: TonB-dependent receptor, partial [Pseudomonadota bacterium]